MRFSVGSEGHEAGLELTLLPAFFKGDYLRPEGFCGPRRRCRGDIEVYVVTWGVF